MQGPIKLASWFFLFCYSMSALACSCSFTGTPAEEKCPPLGNRPLFIGTVTDIVKLPVTEKFQFLRTRKVHLRVDEVFAGVKGDTIEVFTGSGGGDCGVAFEVGEQYLVEGSRDEQGRLLVGICSRTTLVRHAAALLPQLRARRDKEKVASAFGILSSSQHQFRGKYPLFDTQESHLSNVVVKASRGQRVYEAVTNSDGAFAFYDLPAGEYSFDAELPEGWALGEYIFNSERPAPVKLGAGACYEMSLTALPSASIQGRIIDDSGLPQEYVSVTLLPADNPPADFKGPWEGERDGAFRFDHVAPGRYLLVANADDDRGPTDVYPRTFYPGVTNPAAAQSIVVTAGAKVQADIHLQRVVQTRKVRVTALWQDGKPVDLADVKATPQNESPRSGDFKMTSKDGTAELSLIKGVGYSVSVEKICFGCWSEDGATVCGSIAKVGGPTFLLPPDDPVAERTFVLLRAACPTERDGSFVRETPPANPREPE